jgi:hypothetical protein
MVRNRAADSPRAPSLALGVTGAVRRLIAGFAPAGMATSSTSSRHSSWSPHVVRLCRRATSGRII